MRTAAYNVSGNTSDSPLLFVMSELLYEKTVTHTDDSLIISHVAVMFIQYPKQICLTCDTFKRKN